MKKPIVMITIMLLLAGCKSEVSPAMTPIATITASTPTAMPTIVPTITPAATAIPVVERFQLPFPGELLTFNHQYSDITGWAITRENVNDGLQISYTENQGEDWFTTILPTKQQWENSVDEKHLFTSLNATGPSWVMLSSDSSASLVYKSLYRSDDKGRTWTLLGDFTSVISGELKGILFIDEKVGWIAANDNGKEIVPLYHTIDGGKTWSLETLPLEKDFRYGNVGLPYFDQVGHATVKVEYVSDAGNKIVHYESADNGSTWRRFTFNSILQLKGDKAALEALRQFAIAYQTNDVKKASLLLEADAMDYITEIKNNKTSFYSAYSSAQNNDPIDGEFCPNLYYQNNDQLAEYDGGMMAVCMRKQPKSNKWKIYMLD